MKPRIAQIEDLPGINRCICAAFGVYVDRMGKPPEPMVTDYSTHIAERRVYVIDLESSCISAVLVLMPRQDHMYLDTIAVSPGQQGKGMGRELVEFAEDVAANMGFSELHLCTNAHMHENQRWYANLGFTETMRKTVNGYDRIYYRKQLIAEPRPAPDR